MAVPSGGSDKRGFNTSTGASVAFVHAKQGGTILNNNSTTVTNSETGDGIITQALELDDAVAANEYTVLGVPASGDQGLLGARTANNTNASFAYNASSPTLSSPTWVLARVATTLNTVSNTKLLFMGMGQGQAIAQSKHAIGARTVTAFRYDRFTWTGTLVDGTSNLSRHNWLAAGSASVSLPAAMNGGTADGTWVSTTNNAADSSDGAANPTRALPGELVMKVDFVTLAVTDTDSGDFYDYAPITGM